MNDEQKVKNIRTKGEKIHSFIFSFITIKSRSQLRESKINYVSIEVCVCVHVLLKYNVTFK